VTSAEAEVTPRVMAWARETAGYSIDEAADRLAVRPRRLIEWEEGVRSPTLPQARTAARIYRRPLALLFLPEPPEDPSAPPDFRSVPGEGELITTPELRHELRLAESRRATALELDPAPQQRITNLVDTVTVDSDPEVAAADVREELKVSWTDQLAWRDAYAALNGWRSALESLGILIFRFSGVPVDVARGFSLSGAVYPVIALNASDAPAGRVFTLLHELGHLLAGTGGMCDLDDRGDPPSQEARAAERFCNRFAAAILMPRSDLSAIPTVAQATRDTRWSLQQLQETASTIKVSRHALLIRLLEVGRTSNAAYQLTLRDLRALGSGPPSTGFELVPDGAVREVGIPYARLVLSAYQDETITARDLAEYLGVRFKHVARIQDLVDSART
jgi:Zn-dependent peptidase ImmA (M78 family)/transcriptional regulator with XRE-family HTH domain